jgi:hypothetical protein
MGKLCKISMGKSCKITEVCDIRIYFTANKKESLYAIEKFME